MKNIKIILFLVVVAGLLLSSCAPKTYWGVARLPDAREIFITTADEGVFVAKKDLVIPYQPVGFLEIKTEKIAPCQADMKGKYTSLEKAINTDLIEKAKKQLGGDAVIDFQWSASSTADGFLEAAAGNPYLTLSYPIVLLLNRNVISMKGTVVKQK